MTSLRAASLRVCIMEVEVTPGKASQDDAINDEASSGSRHVRVHLALMAAAGALSAGMVASQHSGQS